VRVNRAVVHVHDYVHGYVQNGICTQMSSKAGVAVVSTYTHA
jgi:hypothetical protein